MKKIAALIMAAICACVLAACSSGSLEESEDPAVNTEEVASVKGAKSYQIGVITYSRTDEEAVSFQDYLDEYIAQVFPGITFIYSGSISTEEEELAFIQDACDQGADGFLSFLSLNLKKEVELCEQNKAYYIMASGTVSKEDFASVADNPWFIGEVGPGEGLEYETGADMAAYFAGQGFGNEYFVLSGGASMGNEMHLQRTIGILDKLQDEYGVVFDKSSEEIAFSTEPLHVNSGDLTVCITPGYIDVEDFFNTAKEEYEKDRYEVVLSVLPLTDMAAVAKGAHLGAVDCYSTRNLQLFNSGQLCYVAGKYSSIIGPSFAAMYNAVTGFADDFRDDGKAFALTQGFWRSTDLDDYAEKYGMASSVVSNAYNYEDLWKVCKIYNPDSSLEDLKELTEASTFEDAKRRRGR